MFGIGMPEMILILAIALIVIGPKKLPDLAKSLGRAMNEFKKATREIKESIDVGDDLKDVKKSFDDLNADIKTSVNPLSSPAPDPAAEQGQAADLKPDEDAPTEPQAPSETRGEGNAKHE
ncbi:MAG: twin-arginine translocase TatA/TatE family subunit [Desulfobacterales bacterium]|nr:twin-arginine translocase TatA/TatE family subunit [Desulfobacterales bacterium]MDJ0990529.1 twin-arginine translocase TatA/TatE family subunit [Desulfobacterales bacterium]